MRHWSKIALVLLLLAELLALGVKGTFASYNSEVNNPGSTAATGTLTLSTTNNSVTCESYGGSVGTPSGDDNSNCGTLTITGGPFYPGQSTTTTVQVENSGSLAGTLWLYAANSCTPYEPGICDAIEFYVEEVSSSGTAISCYYPSTGTSCAFDTFSSPAGAGTLTDFTYNDYYDQPDALSLGSIGAATTRYFKFGFELPAFTNTTVGNAYQGQTATFDLTWYLNQGS